MAFQAKQSIPCLVQSQVMKLFQKVKHLLQELIEVLDLLLNLYLFAIL